MLRWEMFTKINLEDCQHKWWGKGTCFRDISEGHRMMPFHVPRRFLVLRVVILYFGVTTCRALPLIGVCVTCSDRSNSFLISRFILLRERNLRRSTSFWKVKNWLRNKLTSYWYPARGGGNLTDCNVPEFAHLTKTLEGWGIWFGYGSCRIAHKQSVSAFKY